MGTSPDRGGNYYWVHYVNIPEDIKVEDLRKILLEYSKVDLRFGEEGFGEKFHYKFGEVGFNTKENTILGLSKAKESKLINFLSDKNNLKMFIDFFQKTCFKRPFYIGKAIDLRSRIKNHINKQGGSPIIKTIEEQKINKSHIWIGFEEIQTIDEGILNIFEEITQIILKPGLTKKFG